jgi:hypothetical protein
MDRAEGLARTCLMKWAGTDTASSVFVRMISSYTGSHVQEASRMDIALGAMRAETPAQSSYTDLPGGMARQTTPAIIVIITGLSGRGWLNALLEHTGAAPERRVIMIAIFVLIARATGRHLARPRALPFTFESRRTILVFVTGIIHFARIHAHSYRSD